MGNKEWRVIDTMEISEWVNQNIVTECGAIGYCLLRREGMKNKEGNQYRVYIEVRNENEVMERQDMLMMEYLLEKKGG